MGRLRGRSGECGGVTKRACRSRLFENTSQARRNTRMTWRGGKWRTTMMTCAAAPCSDGGAAPRAELLWGRIWRSCAEGGAAPRAELRHAVRAELR
ncbi:unnamed protein product [Closterium sp. NIES-54]